MSIKKIKSFGLILCCIVLCMCVVGMITVAPKTRADDDVTAITIEQLTTFTTEDAASIRTETPTGIRFTAAISADEYDGLVKEYGLENLEFGMAIARVGSLEELKALDASKTLKPMSYWAAGAYPGSDAATYKYSFAIVELDANNYNTQYTTIGYVKVGSEIAYATNADGEEVSCTRTPLAVATATLANASGDEAEDLSFANAIIDSALSTATFEVKDITAPWGEEVMLNATVDGKSVTPVYEIDDATIATAEGGKIIGLKKGSTTVTAILNGENGNSYTATATVTFTEKTIAPALNSDGMLALNTEGEETSISVYAANDVELANVLTTATTTAQTFDIRDLIISYMEDNSITTFEDYAYKAVVTSDSYKGVYATEEFVPIKNETIGAGFGTRFGYVVAGTHSGTKAVGHYFFLVEDIDISASAAVNTTGYNQTNVALFNEMSLDGRGHSIVNTYTHTSATSGYTGLFGYLQKTDATVGPRLKWSNVHVQMNITLKENCSFFGLFACETQNVLFENCYFEANVVNNSSNVANLGALGWGSELRNCIVELNNSSNSTNGLYLNRASAIGSQIISNTAIIDATNDAVVSGVTTSLFAENAYGYRSIADFMAGTNGRVMYSTSEGFKTDDFTGKCYENWSDAWEVTDTDVKLFGQTVRTTLQTEVAPVLDANGMLALNTKGEETTISVYAADDVELTTALTKDVTSDTSYDIRELILSYMEKNVAVTGNYSYTVTVESRSYKGTYTSETFVPITSETEFLKLGVSNTDLNASGVKYEYNYLAKDLDVSSYAGKNTRHGVSVWAMMEFNLDGRGHTITNNYEHNTSSSYRGLSCYWGNIDTTTRNWWKNVSYVANITSDGYKLHNLIGCNVTAYDFYNCYFEVTVVNNGTGHCGLFDVASSTFNDCMFVLNNTTEDSYDVIVFAKAEKNCAGSSLNNCAIINNSTETNVVTTDCTGLAVPTAYRYNNLVDFIAGNNGTLRNSDNAAQKDPVADGTKCYTAWDSVWSITDGGISLCGQQIKTVTNA